MRALLVALSCAASHAFRPPLPRKLPTTTRTAIDDLYTSKGVTTTTTRAAVAPPPGKSWRTKEGPQSTLIAGGGPAGLLTAIAFAKRGWTNIRVVDRLREPYDPGDELIWSDAARFYLVGLGLRGQTALTELGAWDTVQSYCAEVVGRKDWAPGAGPDEGVERIFTDRPVSTQVIARDRMQGALYKVAKEKYGSQINFDWETEVDVEDDDVTLTKGATEEVLRPSLIVGADGTARTVAMALEENDRRVRIKRYDDDNCRVFKTVPLDLPEGWRGDVNYSTRSKGGRMNFDALPSDAENRRYCGVLLLREGDALAQEDSSPDELRALMKECLPQFEPFVNDENLNNIAKKPASRLPGFRYVGPRIHKADRVVLLGDAIHTVKPYFGLGANSAFEDVTSLDKCLDEHDNGADALKAFSRARAPEAKALVQISRGFDRPGFRGFVSFILPIILDSIFHAKFPKVFGPNTIASLQRRDTFVRVRWNKRRDRLLQVAVLGSGLYLAASSVRLLARLALSTPAARRTSLIGAAAVAVAGLAAKALSFFERGMAPADVLTKTNSSPVANSNEDFVTN